MTSNLSTLGITLLGVVCMLQGESLVKRRLKTNWILEDENSAGIAALKGTLQIMGINWKHYIEGVSSA